MTPKKTFAFYSLIILLLQVTEVAGQNSLRNFGNLKMFENARIGFQTNLVNDGSFDENKGLVGFYGSESLYISGAFAPQFYDFELFLEKNLVLLTPIHISNETSFFSGNIQTDKADKDLFTEWTENATYEGASDLAKVDGYVLVDNRNAFPFPVGDANNFKPLYLYFEHTPERAKCAYFFESADNQITRNESFDTNALENTLLGVSEREFWNLETEGSARFSITWNENSELSSFLEDVNRITIAGWNETEKQWEDLGRSAVAGDMENGSITSHFFNTTNYRVFTFASLFDIQEDLPGNYLVTPNGDGANDRLIIPELARSPNNILKLYDRNGMKVFEQRNYTNEFEGFATTNNLVIDRERGLPQGVYFYFVKLLDLNMEAQGFIYLAR